MKQNSLFYIPKQLLIILFAACIVRIIAAFMVADFHTDYYWEYGEITKNILAGHGYSLYYMSTDSLEHHFHPNVKPFPSALMAPGYIGFLLPYMLISNNVIRNTLIILTQITITLVTILFLYRFTVQYFSKRAAILACTIACLLPDFIYSVVSFTPTVLYQCMIMMLMAFLYLEEHAPHQSKPLRIAVLFGALIYIRFEFILFLFMYLSLQIFYHRWKHVTIVLGSTAALMVPWMIRTVIVFNIFTPLSTGFGLNFYRGNNAGGLGVWGDDTIKEKILQLPRDQYFEIHLNHLYYTQAWEYISQQPLEETSRLPTKLSHLWIISTLQKRSSNPLYQITSWFVFIFFLVGFLTTFSWQKHKYLYLFLIYSTIIALMLFTLPRHQTMMRITLLPIVGAGLDYVWELLKKMIR